MPHFLCLAQKIFSRQYYLLRMHVEGIRAAASPAIEADTFSLHRPRLHYKHAHRYVATMPCAMIEDDKERVSQCAI